LVVTLVTHQMMPSSAATGWYSQIGACIQHTTRQLRAWRQWALLGRLSAAALSKRVSRQISNTQP
jgi:hypothetical protein